MQDKLTAYAISTGFLFLSSLLASFIFAILYHYDILPTNVYNNATIVIGILLFMIAGALLGRIIGEKGLMHGLFVGVPFLIIAFIFAKEATLLIKLISVLGKGIGYVLGSIVGVNLKRT